MNQLRRWRKTVFHVIGAPRDNNRVGRWFDRMILSLIAINLLAVILETLPDLEAGWRVVFLVIETVSIGIFTVEYILRLWSSVENPGYDKPLSGRVRFALRPMMLIDLLAIVPAYLPFIGVDTRHLRGLRLMRVFQLLKIGRYSRSLQTMSRVFLIKREELIITLSALVILLVIASSLMYYAEHEAQPDNFSSIPATIWWAVITVSTVGYGDVVPVTVLGRAIASVIALLGVGLFALPAGIVASGFSQEAAMQQRQATKKDHDPEADRPSETTG